MKELIIELADRWHSYYAQKHVDSAHRADRLINVELRDRLQQKNEELDFKNLMVDASSGEGNITRGPWLASFDTRVTNTATQGFYVVFLFSTDMKSITLELGLGATQFTKFYGQNKKSLQEIRNAANRMQVHALAILKSANNTDLLQRINLGPSDVTDKPGYSLQRGYEEGAILHISYPIDGRLNDKAMLDDYVEFIKVYQRMVEDETVPTNEELLSISIQPEELSKGITQPEVIDFIPRTVPKRHKGNGNNGRNTKNNPSTSTKKIGDWGEKVVLEREIRYLESNGRHDLAEKVVHEEALKNRPGWDITSYNLDGSTRRIEVKSTVADSTTSLNLTANELDAAEKYGDSYFLYLLTGVTAKGAKRIEKLKNPVKLIGEGTVQVRPTIYEMKLYAEESND